MKNFKKVCVSILLISIIGIMTGCSSAPAPQKDPTQVVKEAFDAIYNAKTMSYEVSMKGTSISTNKPEQNLNFSIKVTGKEDSTDPKISIFSVDLDGSGSLGGAKKESVAAGFMQNNKDVYFSIKNISDFGGSLPSSSTKDFVGKWWKIALPEGGFDELINGKAATKKADDSQNNLNEVLKSSTLYKDVTYVGSNWGDYHYKAVLDKTEARKFLLKFMEVGGKALKPEELDTLDKALAATIMNADIWVNGETMILSKIESKLDLKSEGDLAAGVEGGAISMAINVKFNDINKPVTLTAPKDATDFDVMAFLGALMMAMPQNTDTK